MTITVASVSYWRKKNRLHRALLNDLCSSKSEALNAAKRIAQSEYRHLQDEWLSMKIDTIQAYADRKDMTNFYGALKAIYGPTSSGSSPHSAVQMGTRSSWTKKRSSDAGRSTSTASSIVHKKINNETIARLQQVPVDDTLTDPPTEVCARLAQLVRSLAANQEVPGSISSLSRVELWATFFRHTVRGQGC